MTEYTEAYMKPENEVLFTREFKRSLKPFKNHHAIKEDLQALVAHLKANPLAGDAYGENIYKIRMHDSGSNKGKSGGFRVLYYNVVKTDKGIRVYLITLFAKKDLDNIKKHQAVDIAKQAIEESGADLL